MESVQPHESFEEVYPRHEFAPLVRVALFLANLIKGMIALRFRRVTKESDQRSAGPSHAH